MGSGLVMTSVSGVTFDEAWPRRIYIDVEGNNIR